MTKITLKLTVEKCSFLILNNKRHATLFLGLRNRILALINSKSKYFNVGIDGHQGQFRKYVMHNITAVAYNQK